MRLIASGQDSMQARFVGPNGPNGYTVRRVRPDSVFFVLDPSTIYRAHVDAQGRILHLHAPFTTFKIQLARVRDADVGKYAAAWSAAPSMGILSPADSVKRTVGGANVAIRYSRPAKRGRVVFGDSSVAMEPWGKAWAHGREPGDAPQYRSRPNDWRHDDPGRQLHDVCAARSGWVEAHRQQAAAAAGQQRASVVGYDARSTARSHACADDDVHAAIVGRADDDRARASGRCGCAQGHVGSYAGVGADSSEIVSLSVAFVVVEVSEI